MFAFPGLATYAIPPTGSIPTAANVVQLAVLPAGAA